MGAHTSSFGSLVLLRQSPFIPWISRQPGESPPSAVHPASCRSPYPTALPAPRRQPRCRVDDATIAPIARQPCAGAAAGAAAVAAAAAGDGTAAAGPTCTGRSRSGPPRRAATTRRSTQRRREASWGGADVLTSAPTRLPRCRLCARCRQPASPFPPPPADAAPPRTKRRSSLESPVTHNLPGVDYVSRAAARCCPLRSVPLQFGARRAGCPGACR